MNKSMRFQKRITANYLFKATQRTNVKLIIQSRLLGFHCSNRLATNISNMATEKGQQRHLAIDAVRNILPLRLRTLRLFCFFCWRTNILFGKSNNPYKKLVIN